MNGHAALAGRGSGSGKDQQRLNSCKVVGEAPIGDLHTRCLDMLTLGTF